jgi:transcriptional regulator of acetoin/glycerol metabolism
MTYSPRKRVTGNVRDLANSLERALIMSQGRTLEFQELQPPLSLTESTKDSAESFSDGARRTIQKALEACGGRIYGKDGAAARLGIPPSTLQGKMKKLGINGRRDS